MSLTLAGFDRGGLLAVEVTDPAGHDVTVGEPEVGADASTIGVQVEPLDVGEHVVHWRAGAEDGDASSEGTFTFQAEDARGGGWGTWLVWLFALIPAAVFLRPGRRKGRVG